VSNNGKKKDLIQFPVTRKITNSIIVFYRNHSKIIIDVLVMLVLFGLGIWFRHWLHYWFEENIGRIFYLKISNKNFSSKIGQFLGLPNGYELPWEGYFDWTYYYVPYIDNFLRGWNPYSGSKTPGDPLGGYVYGPFYIYFISIPAWLFNVNAQESAVWSNIVFDSAIISMVYLIVRTKEGFWTSLFAASLYFFSPVVLFYSVVRVLNMPQVTFFIMLYFYLLITDHDDSSLIALVIAILTKQIALFLIGPAVVYWYKKYGPIRGTSFPFLTLIYLIIGSYPWIAINYYSYLVRIFGPGKGKSSLHLPKAGESVTLAESFLYLNYPNFAEKVRIALNSFGNLGLMLIISAITGWLIFFGYQQLKRDLAFHSQIYLFFLMGAHAVMARGIYKYYDPIFIPFLILSLIISPPKAEKNEEENTSKKISKDIPTRTYYKTKKVLTPKKQLIEVLKPYFSIDQTHENVLIFIKNVSVFGIFFFLNERILDINRFLHPLLLFVYTIMIFFFIDNVIWKNTMKEAKIFILSVVKNSYYFFKGVFISIKIKKNDT